MAAQRQAQPKGAALPRNGSWHALKRSAGPRQTPQRNPGKALTPSPEQRFFFAAIPARAPASRFPLSDRP
ncbi:hypothetical protein CS8_046650 [Cupriavidus sp. 8B]